MASENEHGRSWFKRISFNLSATSALTLIFLALAVMTGAYIWGVITGRGMDRPVAEADSPLPATLPESVGHPDKILQAHELEFTQALRDEIRKPKTASLPAQPVLAEKSESPAAPTPQEPDQALPEQTASVENEDNSIYDFVFQVAALRDSAAADNLRQLLEGEGLRTRLEQNGKLFIVLVLMRGTPLRASELANISRNLRLGEPLLRSRKAAPQPARAGLSAIQQSKEN